MNLTGTGKIAGVIGWPVSHSLSPLLHGYWLKEHDINGAYVPLPVAREDFTRVVEGIRRAGFAGVNVTVPHKEAAFALAHVCDRAAMAAGAANLLVFRPDGKIEGRNTDAAGLYQSLKDVSLPGKTAVLLGTGGAARGAVIALDELGLTTIHVLGRDGARAGALVGALQPMVKSRLAAGRLESWADLAEQAALLVNATSAGMKGQAPLELSLAPLAGNAVVCDIVYNPLETALLKQARARGHQSLDGLGMLMHQAVPSFEAFFGLRPKVTPGLRAALEQALS